MSSPIADARQRERALDPTGSFIVQAPAGSGKTELLIQRYLKLLGIVEQPESVLAITFTNKAAGEMRSRVVEALRLAGEPPPEVAHERLTWNLAGAVLERDGEQQWGILDNPSRLKIQTIDSFCSYLVHQMPWLSRFGASPSVGEDLDALYLQAARATLDRLEGTESPAAELESLLRHLDNNQSTLERMLITMLKTRDQWLRPVALNRDVAISREKLEQGLLNVIRDTLNQTRAAIDPSAAEKVIELARFAEANLRDSGKESPIRACAGMMELPGTEPSDLEQWLGIASLLLTKQGTVRKTLTVNEGFPSGADTKTWKQRFESLDLEDSFVTLLAEVPSLPPERYDEDSFDILEALLPVLLIAFAELRMVFRSRGVVDFTEISLAAHQALGTTQEPTDLAFALDCRIQHLLVDEFQDTSQTQYELLEILTADWLSGDGRTLFLVGDPMQSIYRFREAEVGLFLKVRREGVGNLRPTPLTLEVNFRSEAGIVQWVNEAFAEAFPAQEIAEFGAVPYAPLAENRPEGREPAVTVFPSLGLDRDAEAAQVLAAVRESREKRPDDTLTVLVRSRSHLLHIVPRLRSAGIRFRAVDIDSLSERPVVQDLLSLTRALLHTADRTSWFAVLRAPWCGLTLADLLRLTEEDLTSPVWDLIRDEKRREGLSSDGRARLERVADVLEAALQRRGRMTLGRWVSGTWLALGGPACLKDHTSLEDAAAYLELLDAYSETWDMKDPDEFARKIADLFARPDVDADGGVQLMTIHKAKGLEFDTVILPGLGLCTGRDDTRLLLWLERTRANGKSDLLLAPVKQTGAEKDPIYSYLMKVDGRKAEYEKTRLLYVAATRARRHLYLLGHTRMNRKTGKISKPDKRSLLSDIWQTVEKNFESLQATAPAAATVVNEEPLASATAIGIPLRRLPAGWSLPAAPPQTSWKSANDAAALEEGQDTVSFEWAGEIQRHVGTVVHAMLQRMAEPRSSAPNRGIIRTALSAVGVPQAEVAKAASRVENAVTAIQSDDRGRWILRSHQDAHSEYRLTGTVSGQLRHSVVDRTFVDEDGVRWIIDYKTGTHEGGDREGFLDSEQARYRHQLEGYAVLMRGLDSRPIRLGLYFPLLRAWREWAAEKRPDPRGEAGTRASVIP